MQDPPDTGAARHSLHWRGGRVLLPLHRLLVMDLPGLGRMPHEGRALPCWSICQSMQTPDQTCSVDHTLLDPRKRWGSFPTSP